MVNFLKGILFHSRTFKILRALLNGKLTLTEVEGLSDLLEAETELQLKICQQNSNVKQAFAIPIE